MGEGTPASRPMMPRKADHVVVELVHDPKSADRDGKRSERDAVLSRALARKVHV